MSDDKQTVTVSEPNLYDYTAWAFDHKDELRSSLRVAGASEYFVRMAMTVDQNTRHSVLMNLYRWHSDGDDARPPNVDDCRTARERGGGFNTKLWDGHLADAYLHADGNNRPLMEREFTKGEIISVGIESDGPFTSRDYLETLISERWGR